MQTFISTRYLNRKETMLWGFNVSEFAMQEASSKSFRYLLLAKLASLMSPSSRAPPCRAGGRPCRTRRGSRAGTPPPTTSVKR